MIPRGAKDAIRVYSINFRCYEGVVSTRPLGRHRGFRTRKLKKHFGVPKTSFFESQKHFGVPKSGRTKRAPSDRGSGLRASRGVEEGLWGETFRYESCWGVRRGAEGGGAKSGPSLGPENLICKT